MFEKVASNVEKNADSQKTSVMNVTLQTNKTELNECDKRMICMDKVGGRRLLSEGGQGLPTSRKKEHKCLGLKKESKGVARVGGLYRTRILRLLVELHLSSVKSQVSVKVKRKSVYRGLSQFAGMIRSSVSMTIPLRVSWSF